VLVGQGGGLGRQILVELQLLDVILAVEGGVRVRGRRGREEGVAVRDLHFIVVVVAAAAVVGMMVVVVVQGVGVAAAAGRVNLVAADLLVEVLKKQRSLINNFAWVLWLSYELISQSAEQLYIRAVQKMKCHTHSFLKSKVGQKCIQYILKLKCLRCCARV